LVEMMVLLLIVQMAAMNLQPLITLYIAELQGTLEGAVLTSGIVFSLSGIAGALAAPLWGRVGHKAGFLKILVIGFVGAGVINACQYFATDIWQFGLLQFIYGLFIAAVFPAINTLVATNTDTCFRGRAFGLTMSANQTGAMIGPMIGGLVSLWISVKLIFVYSGALLLVVGCVMMVRMRRRSEG